MTAVRKTPRKAPTKPVFKPGKLGPIELRNRIVKSGTNEGMAREGLVTERLIDWHRDFAAGGVAMTTLACCAVSPEGRTFRHQICMREEAFFLPLARQFLAELALPLMLLGGVTRLDTMENAVREGFRFVALGRPLGWCVRSRG